jgi:hypothetical protein
VNLSGTNKAVTELPKIAPQAPPDAANKGTPQLSIQLCILLLPGFEAKHRPF